MIWHECGADPSQFVVTFQAGVVTLEGRPDTIALGRDFGAVKAMHEALSPDNTYPSRWTWR